MVFQFIVHKSNTHIICKLSAHENGNITGVAARDQVHEDVPDVSLANPLMNLSPFSFSIGALANGTRGECNAYACAGLQCNCLWNAIEPMQPPYRAVYRAPG